jgi:UPF0271 protein
VRIDLNADLGEGMGQDDALLEVVTSANVATGAHAGGGALLAATVAGAVRRGVAVGAHPAYPDRAGFGRRSLLAELHADPAARRDWTDQLLGQVVLVAEAAAAQGAVLAHVKPHGALYHDASADPLAAGLVAAAVRAVADRTGHPIAVVTQPGALLAAAAADAGLPVLVEGFADRGYRPDGALVPRGEAGALLADVPAMVAQGLALAQGSVRATDGSVVRVGLDTLCVHGDTPQALAAARALRAALEAAGWQVRAPRGPA